MNSAGSQILRTYHEESIKINKYDDEHDLLLTRKMKTIMIAEPNQNRKAKNLFTKRTTSFQHESIEPNVYNQCECKVCRYL